MVAAHAPFNKAKPNDPVYRFIGGKRNDLFWEKIERNKPDGFFSDNFKDLVQSMLAYEGTKEKPGVTRIDMDGILNHPWMTDEHLPTKE